MKERLLAEILQSQTPYDADFSDVRINLSSFLQYLNPGDPRAVLFLDPLKYAEARAFGIDGQQFISSVFAEKGMQPGPLTVSAADAALNTKDGRLRGTSVTTTAPYTFQVKGPGDNAGCAIVPEDQIGLQQDKISGLSPKEQTEFINYHEFFHCLNDGYNQKTGITVPQQREMFADTGAAIEMIRKGSDPSLVDKVISWRNQNPETTHATTAALKGLKDYIRENGVDKLRSMNDAEVLKLDYKITGDATSSFLTFAWQHVMEGVSLGQNLHYQLQSYVLTPPDVTPKGFNPGQILEDKAFEISGKVTPLTLMKANEALQQEYKDKTQADPGNPLYTEMMIKTQNAFAKLVPSADYETVNARRGAKLTQEDRQDIAFVTHKPTTPASRRPSAPKTSV